MLRLRRRDQIAYRRTFLRRSTGPFRDTRLPGTVAWRGGCPLADRRPVAGTDHSAREDELEASNPGRSGDTHPSLQENLRPQLSQPAMLPRLEDMDGSKKAIVIGGGPAGLVAAIRLAEG